MILRLLTDQLLYPMNQKGNTTHVFLSAVKIHNLSYQNIKNYCVLTYTLLLRIDIGRYSQHILQINIFKIVTLDQNQIYREQQIQPTNLPLYSIQHEVFHEQLGCTCHFSR